MHRLLLILLLLAPLNADEETTEASESCTEDEDYVNEECVNKCIARDPCGGNADCKLIEGTLYCQCKRGYTGSPLDGCFKLDEKNPCNPDPCGPNSECVAEHEEIGPHCKCQNKFYDFPPNCRPGCDSHEECADDEFCNTRENICVKICLPNHCGENSKCRHDKKKIKAYCSCLDGFTPLRDFGCQEKNSTDEIPIEFIKEVVVDPCDEKCGRNAFCENNECVCTQGYEGDPQKECTLVIPTTFDPCNPNPCGPYSICNVVDDASNCSCVDGFGTDYCHACHSSSSCGSEMLCVGGKCIENICSTFCGEKAGCNIFNNTLECFCDFPRETSQPFNDCKAPSYIPPNVIATLLG